MQAHDSGCGSVETCRKAASPSRLAVSTQQAEALCAESVNMAEVQLKNIKKVYPFISGEQKKNKKKKADHQRRTEEEQEEKG